MSWLDKQKTKVESLKNLSQLLIRKWKSVQHQEKFRKIEMSVGKICVKPVVKQIECLKREKHEIDYVEKEFILLFCLSL